MWPILGSLGLILIEASYLPQIRRLYVLKHADDISYFFPGLNLVGRLLAFSYSLHLGQAVFGFGFLVGIILRAAVLGQVFYYRRHGKGGRADEESGAEAPAANTHQAALAPVPVSAGSSS